MAQEASNLNNMLQAGSRWNPWKRRTSNVLNVAGNVAKRNAGEKSFGQTPSSDLSSLEMKSNEDALINEIRDLIAPSTTLYPSTSPLRTPERLIPSIDPGLGSLLFPKARGLSLSASAEPTNTILLVTTMMTLTITTSATPTSVQTPTTTTVATAIITAAPATDTDFDSDDTPIIVTLPPPGRERDRDGDGDHNGYVGDSRPLSQTTEHLLIAAGSVGATIFFMLIAFLLYRVRTGKSLTKKLFPSRRAKQGSGPEISSPRPQNFSAPAYAWDRKEPFALSEANNSVRELPDIPRPTLVRETSVRSMRGVARPFENTPLRSSPSLRSANGYQPPPPPLPKDPSVTRQDGRMLTRSNSLAASSQVIPMDQSQSRTAVESRYTQSSDRSIPPYLQGVADSPPKQSRFSWTNSQAPQTPRDLDPRYSVATSTSSVPRYRTVESWVQQQTGRVEERQIRELLHADTETDPVPDVPHEYRKHYTQASTATVFRHHPGTEVVIPRGSVVPSEILNTKMGGGVL